MRRHGHLGNEAKLTLSIWEWLTRFLGPVDSEWQQALGCCSRIRRRGKTQSQEKLLAHEPTQGRGPAECVRHRFLEAYILAQVLLAEGNLSFVLTTAPIV